GGRTGAAPGPPRPPRCTRRLRSRRALERRPASYRAGRAHWKARGILHRLHGLAPGVRVSGEIRLSLPGAALQVAATTTRNPCPGPPAQDLRRVPRESRSGGEFGARRATAPAHESWLPSGPHRVLAARPEHSDALPGAGVWFVRAVPLLRRPSRPVGSDGARRPGGVPRAVSEHRHARNDG